MLKKNLFKVLLFTVTICAASGLRVQAQYVPENKTEPKAEPKADPKAAPKQFSWLSVLTGPPDQVYSIRTKYGQTIYGTILQRYDDVVIMQTEYGAYRLELADIAAVELINTSGKAAGSNMSTSAIMRHNHDYTYFYSASACNMPAGQKAISQLGAIYTEFVAGLTDHLQVSAGLIPWTLRSPAFGASAQANAQLAENWFGAVSGTVFSIDQNTFNSQAANRRQIGMVKGILTYSNNKASISFSAGFGGGMNFGNGSSPFGGVAGVYSLTPRMAIMAEYQKVFANNTIGISGVLGIRYMKSVNSRWDFGYAVIGYTETINSSTSSSSSNSSDGTFPYPVLHYAYSFR